MPLSSMIYNPSFLPHAHLGRQAGNQLEIDFAEGLKEYFSKFGVVSEAMVMRDPTTKHSR